MTRPLLLLVCAAMVGTSAWGDTHYVSKNGSSTYPYTSWATAADSVHVAIDAADDWDTVLVGPGTFHTRPLVLKQGLLLIGSGRDSTHLHHHRSDFAIALADSCSVQRLHILCPGDTIRTAIECVNLSAALSNLRITDVETGIRMFPPDGIPPTHLLVVDSVDFDDVEYCFISNGDACEIRNSRFNMKPGTSIGIYCGHLVSAVIEGNAFYYDDDKKSLMIDVRTTEYHAVRNNICVAPPGSDCELITAANSGVGPSVIENNLCIGGAIGLNAWSGGDMYLRNNIAIRSSVSMLYDSVRTLPEQVGFNLYWQNDDALIDVDSAARIAGGSIFADPMFTDSLDFHLQEYSPAIDAGDTLLQDPDGSRSDIGPYGGPLGETYTYIDLPPKVPHLSSDSIGPSGIRLNWTGNYEADFAEYQLYRADTSFDTPDTSLLLVSIATDTVHVDSTWSGGDVVYRIRALDRQGNGSDLSNGVGVKVIPVGVGDDGEVVPDRVTLHPSYPNPFNASTSIRYSLSAPSSVTLFIHNILGQRVRVLVDQAMPAGGHEVRWNGRDHIGSDVASGVYFVVMQAGQERSARKAMLLR